DTASYRRRTSRMDHSSQGGATAAKDRAMSAIDDIYLTTFTTTDNGRALTQRLGEQRQTAVHAVIDAAMVVRKFLIHMRHAITRQRVAHSACAIQQIVLIDVAAIDEQQLQSLQPFPMRLDQHQRVPFHPVIP